MWHYVFVSMFVTVLAVEVKEDFDETSDSDHASGIHVNASLAPPTEIEIDQMSRITEPLNYYPDNKPPNSVNNSSSNTVLNKTKNSTFNPSPEIPETIYEYNKYPVVPAYPESKHIYSATVSPNNLRTYLPPAPVSVLHNFYQTTTPKTYLPPRPFYNEHTDHTFQKNKPPIPSNLSKDQPYPYYFNGHSNNEKGYNTQSADYDPHHKHSGINPAEYHKHQGLNTEYHKHKELFPWKNVIHFITALLPIGLLLTALTPTILTVTPVANNDTSKLNRGVEVDPSLLELLEGRAEDVTGCHQTKLICNAASRGRYPGASNLQKSLWLIASQAYDEKSGPREILRLFRAITENKCNELICNKN